MYYLVLCNDKAMVIETAKVIEREGWELFAVITCVINWR